MAKRKDIPKPHNDGEWTVGRFNSFVKSALRKARYPIKYKCIKAAFVKDGINPSTGRKCKLHECAHCHNLFPQKDVQADHIDPIIAKEGFTTWDDVVYRMFCELDNMQCLCKPCHKIKTKQETQERKAYKDALKLECD